MTPIDWDALIPGCSHFRWWEAVVTDHRDLMDANAAYLTTETTRRNNVERMAVEVMEPIREHFKCPVHINSWIRCSTLNRIIGGSPSSEHMSLGPGVCAVDFVVPGFSVDDVFAGVKVLGLKLGRIRWGQLILEPRGAGPNSWIHISLETARHHMEVLT